jgi:phosphoribosylamine--glycine ligase
MEATTNGTLTEDMVRFSTGAACCVVMASEGYPGKYETGFEITLPEEGLVYVAGAKLADGKLLTAGGRVLGAVYADKTLEKAIEGAYALTKKIHFENAYCRSDIGQRALAAKEGK